MEDVILKIKGIHKSFNDTDVLKGIDLEVNRGEFITLLGSSGCGKTTTLRLISGLEVPDKGQIILEGEDVTDVEPNKRNVNTVFQSYALFPHMNIGENVGYGLKIKKTDKRTIKKEVAKMLELVQLSGFEKRMPGELSGGQRQRVAIARALIAKPQILLLDEPLGALDLRLRRQMQLELKRLQKKLGTTFIYITHDQEEALNMSDRIAVMLDGKFEQIGTPQEIYDEPKTAYVASFVGEANVVCATVQRVEDDKIYAGNGYGTFSFSPCGYTFRCGQEVRVAVRSENAEIEKENGQNGLSGVVTEKNFSGGMLRIETMLDGGSEFICSRHGIDSPLETGDKVKIVWRSELARPVDVEAG